MITGKKMKEYTFQELLYFTGEKERKIDLYGKEDTALDAKQTESFLRKNFDVSRKWYRDEFLDQKAVENDIEKRLAEQITPIQTKVRKTCYLENMFAAKKRTINPYQNVFLYAGAEVCNDELIFSHDKRPNAAAKIEFPDGKDQLKISMEIWIPSEYRTVGSPAGDYGEAMGGRIIELRCGTLYVAKIKFFASGAVKVSEFDGNIWQPKFHFFDLLKFDEYNQLTIEYQNGMASFEVNGQKIEKIRGISQGKADNLFFEGSMLAWSYWKVRNLTVDGAPFEFIPDHSVSDIENIGMIRLPYGIGTIDNKDCELHLSGTFEYQESEKVFLTADTLDPSGKVYVNGSEVLNTDSFEENRMDITSYVKEGTNEIQVIVMPRAPEINYYWHRHTDCYNGWWCGEVKVEFVSRVHIQNVTVITNTVSDAVNGVLKAELNESFDGLIEFLLKKIYPNTDDEFSVGTVRINGSKAELPFSEKYDLWDVETPNLYEIRAVLKDINGHVLDDYVDETGFRTISQNDGKIYLNGKRIVMTGALMMQFLEPYEQIPVNHNCPSTEQIAWQALALKKMNGNTIRLHQLGYGSNDKRYARIMDRVGLMTIWTTRYIDTLEVLVYNNAEWYEKKEFIKQAKKVINHPSIVMWEGSNEFHGNLTAVDRMYTEFVDAVRTFDTTRLICPLSHHYSTAYASTNYFDDEGRKDRYSQPVSAGRGWKDPLVVRSSHPYGFFCGYGSSWANMRKHVEDMLEKPHLENAKSKKHAYLATEYAVVSLANMETEEAKKAELPDSYEVRDLQSMFERKLERGEWEISQSMAALCAYNATKLMKLLDFDGMLWCCLSSGANNGAYMKPPIDFYGYKKLSFYALKDLYGKLFAGKEDLKVCYGTDDRLTPVVFNNHYEGCVDLKLEILNEDQEKVFEKDYHEILLNENGVTKLSPLNPQFANKGYYLLRYTIIENE